MIPIKSIGVWGSKKNNFWKLRFLLHSLNDFLLIVFEDFDTENEGRTEYKEKSFKNERGHF